MLDVWSEDRRLLLRGRTKRARALNASPTRDGWFVTRFAQPGVSITSVALLWEGGGGEKEKERERQRGREGGREGERKRERER